MTNTKHTPGPWIAYTEMDGRHKGYSILTHSPEFLDEDTQPYHPYIASAHHGKRQASMETAKANACLIASAPELLEALVEVVSCEYDRDEESRNFDNATLQQFKRLIAKARGE